MVTERGPPGRPLGPVGRSTNEEENVTEQMMHELVEQDGLSEEAARLRMRDEDLWLLHPGARFDEDLQGEEGVRLWEEAANGARAVADIVSNGPGTIRANAALTTLVWDAAARAEVALERAIERLQEPRVRTVRTPETEPEPEAEERLRELLERCDALGNAYAAVLGEDVPNAEAKAKTLGVLQEMKEEAQETFRRYKQEVGIPDPTA
jgi:hypothetical protein